MRTWIAPVAALLVTTTVATAQSPIPSLKGTWKGTGKILLFGTTEYLSGSPREAAVRDLEVTHTVLGQDGRLIWGTTSAGNNDVKEPFAWAVTADNKTIIGADTDGYYRITILSPTRWRNATCRMRLRPGRRSWRPALSCRGSINSRGDGETTPVAA